MQLKQDHLCLHKSKILAIAGLLSCFTHLSMGIASDIEEDSQAISTALQFMQEEKDLAQALALSSLTPEQEEQEILTAVTDFQAEAARQDGLLSQDQHYHAALYQEETKEILPQLTRQIILLEEDVQEMEEEHTRLAHDINRSSQSVHLQKHVPAMQISLAELKENKATTLIKLDLLRQQFIELSNIKDSTTLMQPETP